MSTILNSRERELTGLLKQKESELKQANAELEERGKLLYKTKVAIEQLQQELSASRREEQAIREEANKVCEEQASQLRQAEEQIQQLEEQLAQSTSKLKEFQNKSATLEGDLEQHRHQYQIEYASLQQKLRDKDKRLAALEEELDSSADHGSSLEKMLKDSRAKISALELDREEADRMAREMVAKTNKLQAENTRLQQELEMARDAAEAAKRDATHAASHAELAGREKAALERDWQRRLEGVKGEYEQRIMDLERKQRDVDAQWANKQEASERSWASRMQEVELHWEKRLRDGMSACERKFSEESREWERRLADCDASWQAKVAELEGLWRARMADIQRTHEGDRTHWEAQAAQQRSDLEMQWNARVEEVRRSLEVALEEAQAKAASERMLLEQTWAKKLQDLEALYSKKLEDSQHKWASETARSEEAWAGRLADVEVKYKRKLDETKRRAVARELEIDTQWKEQLDAEKKRARQEAEQLSSLHTARVSALLAEKDAELKSKEANYEEKLLELTSRVEEDNKKMARYEVHTRELLRQLEEERGSHEGEASRRADLDRTLRDTITMYKQDLYDKQAELDEAYREARSLRQQLALQQVIVHSPRLNGTAAAAAGALTSPAVGSRPSSSRPAGVLALATEDAPSTSLYQVSPLADTLVAGTPGSRAQGTSAAPASRSPHQPPAAASPSHATAAELEQDLQILRQARTEFQRSLLVSEDARSSLLDALDRRTNARPDAYSRRAASSADATPLVGGGLHRPGEPDASPYHATSPTTSRFYHRAHPSNGHTLERHSDMDNPPSSFEDWKDRLTTRLHSALRKLEPSLR